MTVEQINKSSLAFINRVSSVLGRRVAENIGMPYPDRDKSEAEYPLNRPKNVERYGEYKGRPNVASRTSDKEEKVFNAGDPAELMRFWSDVKPTK